MLEGLKVLIESLPTSVFWGVYFLIELVNLYYMTRFLGYPPKRWGCRHYGLLTASLIVIGIATSLATQINGWLNLYWVCILPCLEIILVSFALEGNNKELATGVIQLAANMTLIVSLSSAIFSGHLPLFYEGKTQLLSAPLSASLFSFPLFFCFTYRKSKIFFNFRILSQKHIVIILIFIVAADLLGGAFHAYSGLRQDDFQSRAVTSAYAMMVVSLAALLCKFMNENTEKHRYLVQVRINEALMKKQRQYYTLLLDKEKETKRFRHDINNHFNCIEYLLKSGSYGEAIDYVGEIIQRAAGLKPSLETGNEILNAVVSDLLHQFIDINFKINWMGRFPAGVIISSADLCIIFANALTNAIEAIQKLNSTETEIIDVTIKSVGANLYVHIQNPCVNPTFDRGKRPRTDKPDKTSHGFGSQNITECIERYGGSVRFYSKGTAFVVEMAFVGIVETCDETDSETPSLMFIQ